jgi:hypothetical protein
MVFSRAEAVALLDRLRDGQRGAADLEPERAVVHG